MATTNLPKGRIRQLITHRARQKIVWSFPGYAAFWGFIFLIPWEAWMEENGAAPLALNAWNKLQNFGEAPLPWVSVSLTVILILMALSTFFDGLKERSNPAKHRIIELLKEQGHDPIAAVSAYERELKAGNGLDGSTISATPEWIFIAGDDARLMPLSDLLWMHYKSDASQDAVLGVFSAAGLVSRRQAQLAADGSDVVALYFKSLEDPIKAESSMIFADETIVYLSAHNPDVIFGWDKSISKLWEKDRENFTEKARARVQVLIQNQQAQSTGTGDPKLSDVFEQGERLMDKLGD